MTDTPTPDLTAPEQVNKSIGMCRLHGLHGTEATLRALAAERDALRARAEAAEAKVREQALDYLALDGQAIEALAEAERLRAELVEAESAAHMHSDEAQSFAEDLVTERQLRAQAEAERDRLRLACRIIAGQEQCLDNLMSHADIARAALTAPAPQPAPSPPAPRADHRTP